MHEIVTVIPYSDGTLAAKHSAMGGGTRNVRLAILSAVSTVEHARQRAFAPPNLVAGVNEGQAYPQCQQYLGLGWCCTE